MRLVAALLVCLALLPLAARAQAEFNPARPVRVVVGFAPGTPPEVVARVLAERMGRSLGATLYVENRPGAAGTIAADVVAKAPPDGHTLMLGVAASLAVAPHLLPGAKYDPARAFTPIGLIQRSPYFVTVSSELPVTNLRELVDYDRRHPGKLAFAVPGLGTPHHLALELLMARTGAKLTVVPFAGSPPMVLETLAGRTSGFLDVAFPLVADQIRAGKLRQIAITDVRRAAAFPATATAAEQGFPDLTVYSWWGLVGPAGLTPSTVRTLNDALNQALADRDVRQRLRNEGIDEESQRASTPEEFGAWIRAEHARAGEIIRNAGIRLQ